MSRKVLQIIIHIAAWGCFLMLPLFFFPRPLDAATIPDQAFTLFFVLNNLSYIAFYYLNSNLLIPKLLEHNKVFAYTTILILLMIFFGIFPRLYQYFFGDFQRFSSSIVRTSPRSTRPPILSGGAIAIFLLVFIFSTGIKVINKWLQSERRSKLIENEKLKTEISFLKTQINPHFLFNTLNNIYSLAADKSDLTAPAVMKLSSIMRYVLSESKNETVPLDKEIHFTNDYIELQKMRTTSKTCIVFTISGTPNGQQISPLLFLPFVENAFKYGLSAREQSPISILLEIQKNNIFLKVKNNKHQGSNSKTDYNTGIGLNNTKRRLDLLYPNKHTLVIDDEPSSYTINLNILL
ncbi:MAG: histidine kinase [Bacteroidetes bacterium]|nr:histidine kinase [Bacteroidota bacterium]